MVLAMASALTHLRGSRASARSLLAASHAPGWGAPSAQPLPAPPPATVIAPPAPSPVNPVPTTVTTTGVLHTPPDAAGHRVFVDGRFTCASGESCRVRCGASDVRIGSHGRTQKVTIPCGGEVRIER